MAGPDPTDDDSGGRLSVKLLAFALVAQLILFGGLIALTLHGFPFLGGSDDSAADKPVPATVRPGTVPKPTVNRFDATSAMGTAKMQVDAGQRPAGSETLRAVAEKLKAE